MTFRKFIFWLHLVVGLVAGVVIAIMSFTGATLAFEKEIIAFAERDVRHISGPPSAHMPQSASSSARPSPSGLSIEELERLTRAAAPTARLTAIVVSSDPNVAVAFLAGRDGGFYADPLTGDVRSQGAPRIRAFMRTMTDWHRWLALDGPRRPLGKAVTGVSNAAFLFLALSGLWLWWPRKWRTKGLARSLIIVPTATGKARDWNWHNVIGFWSLPVLLVLTASGLVISYRWAGDIVYRLAGETPPAPGAVATVNPVPSVPPPLTANATSPLTHTALFTAAQRQFPAWETITLRLPAASSETPGSKARDIPPAVFTVKLPGTWPRTAATTLTLDPFTGNPLKTETFADLSTGRRARTWLRFLHTGEALGWPGQVLAGLASLGACVLVYTGFALAWHRFFIRSQEKILPPTVK